MYIKGIRHCLLVEITIKENKVVTTNEHLFGEHVIYSCCNFPFFHVMNPQTSTGEPPEVLRRTRLCWEKEEQGGRVAQSTTDSIIFSGGHHRGIGANSIVTCMLPRVVVRGGVQVWTHHIHASSPAGMPQLFGLAPLGIPSLSVCLRVGTWLIQGMEKDHALQPVTCV